MMSIFLDFSRAFDTLSHNILMKKLYHYGFRGKTFDWIENYLTNRKQFVQYNDKVSKLANIVNGVPQGSILGPLLFILYVNKYLSWKDHITYISNKISKGIGILIRTRHLLFRHTLLYLYNSLIKPHFTYCISTWGNTSKTRTNKLMILQKKVVRIISYAAFHTHTKLLLFKLNILTVVHFYQYAVCKLIYNSLNGTVPIFLRCMFEKNRNKRNSQNLRSFYHKKKLSEQGVKYSGPQIWNKLPLLCKLPNLFRNL